MQKDHGKREIYEIVQAAHRDKNKFWRKIKMVRNPKQHEVFAIRNKVGEVVYDIEDVVNVWRDHFDNISLPRYSDSSDAAHFEHVTNIVNEWWIEDEEDEFLHQQISIDEVRNGLKIPQKGKGCDQANYFYP